jgi:predicted nucleic acid-binding protein
MPTAIRLDLQCHFIYAIWYDIWIAAQARQSGGELAARDGHFAELPMLRLAVEIPLEG